MVRALDGSGHPDHGIVVFVEPVRWLFIVWGFVPFVRGLRRAGCGHCVRLFRWSRRAGALFVLPDLMRRQRLLTKARRLARFLDQLAEDHPGRTIHLCGYSSGCYLVTEAIRHVRRPDAVGAVVLLASTLSPGYALHGVVQRVRALQSFHSRLDFLINGLAPRLFGCNDRRRVWSAGMVGFTSPPSGVTQHTWTPADIRLGYLGDHFSITAPRFVAARVAPVILSVSPW